MQRNFVSTLNENFFWDVDINTLDDIKNQRLIIERVLSSGDLNDVKRLFKYFGKETIKQEVVKAGFIDKKTLNWLSFYFGIPKQEFKCYSKTRSTQVHWNF